MSNEPNTKPKKRGCFCGCIAGCLKAIVVGTTLTVGAYYLAGDRILGLISKLPDPYERNVEEKKAVEEVIKSLFQGRSKAEQFLTNEYRSSLDDSYWQEMSELELLSVRAITTDRTPLGLNVYFSIKYHNKKTNVDGEETDRLIFQNEGGLWKLNGK